MDKEINKLYNDIFNDSFEHIYLAPARINIIGEHIDYNGGKVFPAAISLNIKGYVRKNNTNNIRLYSKLYPKLFIFDINDIKYDKNNNWANYPLGMIYIFKKHGYIINKGLDVYFESNIPEGSGLSSSAALLDLMGLILNEEFNLGLTNKEIAVYAKEAENDFNHLACGIMDQMAIAVGKKNHAILLDTANYNYDYHLINLDNYKLVILSTNKKRELTDSKYNERVSECNKALDIIKTKYDINNLCDLDISTLPDIKLLLNDDILYKRVKHVITENDRVYNFIKAIKNKDINKMGKLLNESDDSLKNDYEVTGYHLDMITGLAKKYPSCIGARMTGAGFGGCGIAVVEKDTCEDFKTYMINNYYEATLIKPTILDVEIDDGIRRIK